MKKKTDNGDAVKRVPTVNDGVPYGLIRPDPNQPRKHFSAESLNELAESIRQNGILQPLILELVPARYALREPELHDKQWHVIDTATQEVKWSGAVEEHARKCARPEDLAEHYRIVCGERRWRAIGLLADTGYATGTKRVPAVVHKSLTADQRFAMQYVENNQRENLTTLEEATALRRNLDARQQADPQFSPEDLAREMGISRASVYERLKLTRLHPPVRAALEAGTISTSVAGVICLVPLPKQQEALLKRIEEHQKWRAPASVRTVQEWVDEEYVRQLKAAPFDTAKTYDVLVKTQVANSPTETNPGPCQECPERTGNMLGEFPEFKSRPNVCTRPDCFAQKCKAHWLTAAKDQAQRGKTVLNESEFRKMKADYVAGAKHEYAQNKSGTFEQLMGRHKPEPVLVATAKGLEKWYPKKDVPAALKANGVKLYGADVKAAETPEQKAKRVAKEEADRARAVRRVKLARSLMPRLALAIGATKDADAWKLLAKRVEDSSWDADRKKLLALAKTDRARVLTDGLCPYLDDAFRESALDSKTAALWKALGVDLEAEFEKLEKAADLPPKEFKEVLDIVSPERKGKLTPAAKARIQAAAKARWAKIKAKQ